MRPTFQCSPLLKQYGGGEKILSEKVREMSLKIPAKTWNDQLISYWGAGWLPQGEIYFPHIPGSCCHSVEQLEQKWRKTGVVLYCNIISHCGPGNDITVPCDALGSSQIFVEKLNLSDIVMSLSDMQYPSITHQSFLLPSIRGGRATWTAANAYRNKAGAV